MLQVTKFWSGLFLSNRYGYKPNHALDLVNKKTHFQLNERLCLEVTYPMANGTNGLTGQMGLFSIIFHC